MPHIALQNGQPLLQPVDADVLLRGAASLRPQLDARDRAGRIARAEKHTERAAARAEIGHTRPRRQRQEVRKQQRVRAERHLALRDAEPQPVPQIVFHGRPPHHELRITNY